MDPNTLQQLKEMLNPLAEKLGQGAEALYQIYVRQMITEGILGVIVAPILLSLYGIVTWKLWANWKKKEHDYMDDPVVAIAFTIFGGFISFFVFLWLCDSILHLLNPAYYAIDRIISGVRGQ